METPEDLKRYSRVLAVPEIGAEGQARISAGSVLMVGAGALGSIVGLYLAGAGVGRIRVVDPDVVDVTNLHRQVAYAEELCAQPKAPLLARRMHMLNSTITVDAVQSLVNAHNFDELSQGYDLIADCTDNPLTKQLLSALSLKAGKMCVTGGVDALTAQVFVTRPHGPAYADVFGQVPAQSPRAVVGVLGPVAGVAASLQTSAILLHLAGTANPATLVTLNVLTNKLTSF